MSFILTLTYSLFLYKASTIPAVIYSCPVSHLVLYSQGLFSCDYPLHFLHLQFLSLYWIIPVSKQTYCNISYPKNSITLDPIPPSTYTVSRSLILLHFITTFFKDCVYLQFPLPHFTYLFSPFQL